MKKHLKGVALFEKRFTLLVKTLQNCEIDSAYVYALHADSVVDPETKQPIPDSMGVIREIKTKTVDKKDVPSKSNNGRLFNPYNPPIRKVQVTWAT